MLMHDLAFAVRLLRRSPAYTAITIGGFGFALAICILVLQFVRHELGYDAWLRDADRIHRVHMTLTLPGRTAVTTSRALAPLRDRLARDPDVAAAGRLVPLDGVTVREAERSRRVNLTLVDPELLDALDLPLARGDRALAGPEACLVTERLARALFGDADPIGRALSATVLGRARELRVTGVLRDLPARSHLVLELVARLDPLDAALRPALESWNNVFGYTYVRLRPGAEPAAIERRLDATLAAHVPPLPGASGVTPGGDVFSASLVPVRSLHLHGATNDEDEDMPTAVMRPLGDATTLYAVGGVGVLLLAIAIGNFVNLTTARAGRRAREIAIRKAAGARRRDLVIQHLLEAVLIAAAAMALALVLAELAQPWFEQLAERELDPPHDAALLATLAAAALVLGLGSGLYPALVLSSYHPAEVMRRTQASVAGGAGRLRAALVFAQFTAALLLALGTLVVVLQTRHATGGELGFAHRDRIAVEDVGSRAVRERLPAWLDRAARIPGVERVALTSDAPGAPSGLNMDVAVPGAPDRGGLVRYAVVSPELFPALGIAPVAGRLFSRDVATDDSAGAERAPRAVERGVVLNEAAVRRLGLGLPAAAVGRPLEVGVSRDVRGTYRVIGVVPDVSFGSIRREVDPTVYVFGSTWLTSAIVVHRPGAGPSVRRELEALWRATFPDRTFAAEHLSDRIDAMYANERRLSTVLSTAALLALAVACLGLYGLAAFLAESRRKELAIRRVVGASTADLVWLLAWRLARPIALACAVATPVAYVAAERWLSGFAYRIALGPAVFAAAITGAVAIAAATVAAQSLRAARATPIEALRAE